jgi:hypothetical protein
MKRILLCLLCFMSLSAYAQHTVVVNPDGTHSVAIQTGNNITVVNPDGTHSTGIQTGNIITVVNPDGTHTTVIENGVSAIYAQPTNIFRDIPQQVEYITVYTQYRKPRSAMEKAVYGDRPYLCPYVIRFQDSTALTIPEKQMKTVIKRLKRIPVEQIEFMGFELEHIGNMLDDEGAQRASATVAGYGLHDYAKRDTPVYYYRRK